MESRIDKIKKMTDVEIATWIDKTLKNPCNYCINKTLDSKCDLSLCISKIAEWLNQKA